MSLNLDKLRAETPGVQDIVHFNNAGAALMPEPVLSAQINHLKLEARIGGYEAAAREAERCSSVYESVARLIGASLPEIAPWLRWRQVPDSTAWVVAPQEESPGGASPRHTQEEG